MVPDDLFWKPLSAVSRSTRIDCSVGLVKYYARLPSRERLSLSLAILNRRVSACLRVAPGAKLILDSVSRYTEDEPLRRVKVTLTSSDLDHTVSWETSRPQGSLT